MTAFFISLVVVLLGYALQRQQRRRKPLPPPTPPPPVSPSVTPTTADTPEQAELDFSTLPVLPAVPETPPVQTVAPANLKAYRPEGFLQRSVRGEPMRSKSEIIIAALLQHVGIEYQYEYALRGTRTPGIVNPDFVLFCPNGELLVWEHLGAVHDPYYMQRWEEKRAWYLGNGFIEGHTLIVTRDSREGGLDAQTLAHLVRELHRRWYVEAPPPDRPARRRGA